MKTIISRLSGLLFLAVLLLTSTSSSTVFARGMLNYPTDPTSAIPWSGGTSGVSDIQAAFNNGRTQENAQLGKSIPMLTMPPQAAWDAMTDGQKALWLINRERIDRGIMLMDSVETNVTSVAQSYATYLMNTNQFGHYADGGNPWQRLNANPTINACHDFLSVAENLAAFMSSTPSIPLPVERAVYNWTYDDAGSNAWGHRHMNLWYPYNDNSGTPNQEGFLGIGRAAGGPYQGYSYGVVIVMNVFDPCSSWSYSNPVPTITSLSPSSATAGGAAFTLTVNGTNFLNSSVIRWNGSNRTTTYVCNTQLTASITTADIATAGSASVTVFNPAPGGGTSNTQTFTINPSGNPVPTITSLSPSSATAGGAAFTLTVNGTNFLNSSVIRWNGSNRTTAYASSSQLTASITTADIATAGSASVTVFNPAPGGGTSNARTFTIAAGKYSSVYLPLIENLLASSVPTPGFWQNSNGHHEFYVLTGSSAVKNHAVYVTVIGGSCDGNSYWITENASVPISNNHYSFSDAGFYADGMFTSSTTASVTDGFSDIVIDGCGTASGGPWTWDYAWQNSNQAATAVRVVRPVTVKSLQGASGYEVVRIQ